MTDFSWAHTVDVAVTACDRDGKILFMNDRAATTFAADGGRALVGKSLLPCHPEAARLKIGHIMDSRQANTYTIEKGGVKKLIHQAPWYADGELGGLVEFAIVLPAEMPHFKRS